MLFSFCAKDDVASATTAAHQDVNCRRHVNRQGNRKVHHPSRLQVQASNSFLLTRGDNTHPSTPSKNRLALVFVASSVHGMGLVMTRSVSEAISHRETNRDATQNLMKAITTKEFVSLAAIAIIAPLFALALIGSLRVMVAAGHEFLLLTLTLCGAVVSGINGFGRRTAGQRSYSPGSCRGPQSNVALRP